MRPVHPNFRIAQLAHDSPIRTLVEAQAESRSDVLKTKVDLQSADTFVARNSDFPSANSLTAAAATVEAAVLASAPAANALYEAHFKVSITPVIPGAGTNSHKVTVSVETDPTGVGSWTEQWRFDYEVVKKVGETNTPIVWPSERMPVRVTGFNASGKLRLKIAAASGPGGWSFSVHGFNLATDGDLLSGVTYHTGPAIDFLDSGGATLADTVISKISSSTSNANMTDLGGPPLVPEQAPFVCARVVWGKDDGKDIALDRFTAQLHPCVDGVPANKNVAFFLCQPYALQSAFSHGVGSTNDIVRLMPLCDPVRVPAGDGTTAQDYVFSFFDKTVRTLNHQILSVTRKPRPKSVQPTIGNFALEITGSPEYDVGPTTYWFLWAVQADGTPATNVAWLHDTGVSEVVNGSRKLRTIAIARHGDHWDAENITRGAATRPVLRCKVECGSYANANLEYTGGNLIDLGAAPTQTVMFRGIAAVPDGCQAVFEVRNDADSAWLTFTDGQTAAEVGVSQRQTYKVRCRLLTNSTADATPTLWEIGVVDVKKVWLSDLVKEVRAVWDIPDVAELIPSIPEFEIVLIKNGELEFNDRVTKLLSENYVGTLSLRLWRGDPARPRNEWLHKDDGAYLEDYDPRGEEVTIIAHSPLVFVNGVLPVYNTTTQKQDPLQYANKTPRQAYDDIVNNQLGADIPARNRGDSLPDDSTLISNTIEDSGGLTELNAIAHIAGCVLSTAAGRLKSFPMFGPGAVQAIFSSEKIAWASTSPGLRQRVPRCFVNYSYDLVAQKYGGVYRAISGNDILASNGKAGRIDARPNVRDEVCRWIPNEKLAQTIGQRRVDTLGGGMLVWRFSSTEFHPELELGDVVAVETDRFFIRDPTQTAQRTLKGALWAIGRIVSHNLEGNDFAVWIQSYADIFGANDNAVVTRVSPKLSSVLTYVLPNGEFETWDSAETDKALPHSWDVDRTGTTVKSNKETTPASVFSGSFAAKYSNPDNATNGGWHGYSTNEAPLGAFSVPLRPGVSYTIRIASRSSRVGLGQQYRLKIAYNAAESSTFIKQWTYRAANTYQFDVVTFTVPTTAEPYSKLYIEFNRNGDATATDFWLDSIRLNELVDRLFFDNGDVSGTVTIDWSIAPTQRIRATANVTFVFTGGRPGVRYVLEKQQDGTGGRTYIYPADVTWSSDTPPSWSTGADKLDTASFEVVGDDTQKYYRGSSQALNQTSYDVKSAIGTLLVDSAFTAGTDIVVTGLGFQPTLILFWTTGRGDASDAAGRSDFMVSFGAQVSLTQRSMTTWSDDGVATASGTHMYRNDSVINEVDGSSVTGTLITQAVGSDGFTVRVSDQFVTSRRVHWMALGGKTFKAEIGDVTTPAGPGNQTTSTGFKPTGLILCGSAQPVNTIVGQGASLGLGFATSSSQRYVVGEGHRESTSQTPQSYGFTGECFAGAIPLTADDPTKWRADLVSFNTGPNGFTLNWLETGGSGNLLMYIAVAGCRCQAGNVASQTDTTTDSAITTAVVIPKAALLISHNRATSTSNTPDSDAQISIGAAVANPNGGTPMQRAAASSIQNTGAVSSVVAGAGIAYNAAYQNLAVADGSLEGRMQITGFSPGGLTARMDDADPVASRIGVLLIGA